MDAHQPEGALEGTGDPIPPSEGNLVLGILQQYGWFLVLGAVALYFLWEKIQPKLHQFQRDREERNLKKYDSNTAQKRMEQMDQARQRLQQQYDAQAQTFAEFQRQKEEEKRKERIEDWDRHLQGKGYRNKYRPEENPTKTSPPSKKPEKKTPLRPSDFNPLMGSGGGSYRPPTRRTGGG